jgi:hypothetical protein
MQEKLLAFPVADKQDAEQHAVCSELKTTLP